MKFIFAFLTYLLVHTATLAQDNSYMAVYRYQTPYNINKRIDSIQALLGPNIDFKFFQKDGSKDSVVSGVSKHDSLYAAIGRLETKLSCSKLKFIAHCTSISGKYTIIADTGLKSANEVTNNILHKTYSKTVVDNNSMYIIIDNVKYIKSVISKTSGADSQVHCWAIDTSKFHFVRSGKQKTISKWKCDEYKLTSQGNEDVSVWINKEVPSYIHPQEIIGIGLPGGIVALEFRNKCLYVLTDLDKVDSKENFPEVCNDKHDLKRLDILNIAIRNW